VPVTLGEILTPERVIALQTTAGNAAVTALIGRCGPAAPGAGYDARSAILARRVTIQSGAGRAGGPQLTRRLLDRLNAVSHALEFRPVGNELHALLRPGRTAADLSDFERRMAQFIDLPGIPQPAGGGGPAAVPTFPCG